MLFSIVFCFPFNLYLKSFNCLFFPISLFSKWGGALFSSELLIRQQNVLSSSPFSFWSTHMIILFLFTPVYYYLYYSFFLECSLSFFFFVRLYFCLQNPAAENSCPWFQLGSSCQWTECPQQSDLVTALSQCLQTAWHGLGFACWRHTTVSIVSHFRHLLLGFLLFIFLCFCY